MTVGLAKSVTWFGTPFWNRYVISWSVLLTAMLRPKRSLIPNFAKCEPVTYDAEARTVSGLGGVWVWAGAARYGRPVDCSLAERASRGTPGSGRRGWSPQLAPTLTAHRSPPRAI